MKNFKNFPYTLRCAVKLSYPGIRSSFYKKSSRGISEGDLRSERGQGQFLLIPYNHVKICLTVDRNSILKMNKCY